ncbi:molybdopterin biosynthesis protein [candidate division KSB3 bacterium]|uniref:Molybdopterin molybdenumtransferase n=1 Tax=candidate division KSB3 bacterium TaxID=2044937 RepID=A0A2G6E3M1_9BACT|nr:MAG: molybdopterin biosynthesis protein [candidate division KSB3 bacterium]PIE29263.1 MAG: molybdopterin biosynthesis protein [candidate division KSB3 bacterium]
MTFNYLENRDLDQALFDYLSLLAKSVKCEKEKIPVTESLARVTSDAVYAALSCPHYLASAMDGIAVRVEDTFGASARRPVLLTEGEDFLPIDTGDPIPEGYDGVIMIEDVIPQENGRVKIIVPARPFQHIRQIGEDMCQREMIVPSGMLIRPQEIGALLASGIISVSVWKKPLVGIIPTGDEIVEPAAAPEKGQILECNSAVFSAMIALWGGRSKIYEIIADDCEVMKRGMLQASRDCDMVLVIAGSSAGRDDYTNTVIAECGTVCCHGLAIKPGKPAILGIVEAKPVIGIPGYPVSGIIVMENVVKEVFSLYTGISPSSPQKVSAFLARTLLSSLKYREFKQVRLGRIGKRLTALPISSGAGVLSSSVKADGMLTIPQNCEGYERGSTVEIELLRSAEEIERNIVLTGSHDPLVDELNDLIRRKGPGHSLASTHVGSLNGIMALKAGETHVAGIHLLDEKDGAYNISFLKKYLDLSRIVLIKGVTRRQGLLIAPENPLKIKGVADLAASGVRYVNRQKGSGTRLLFDYLVKQEGVSPRDIYGYAREEFTHISVAAQIAEQTADAGLAIYGVARIYGLHFIPVWEEEYDFVLSKEFYESFAGRLFLSVLKSEALKERLARLGGYGTGRIGEVEPFENSR